MPSSALRGVAMKIMTWEQENNMAEKKEKWEEIFDKEFSEIGHKHNERCEWQCCLRGDIKEFIRKRIFHTELDILDEYTNFLIETGYVDSDVYAEEPTAINRFLDERKAKKEVQSK